MQSDSATFMCNPYQQQCLFDGWGHHNGRNSGVLLWFISSSLAGYQGYKVYDLVLKPTSITIDRTIPFIHMTNLGLDTLVWIIETLCSVGPSIILFLVGIVTDLTQAPLALRGVWTLMVNI
jgi:hypothetical protein